MSSGNKFIDDQIAAAGSQLADMWRRGQRPVQPENDLHPGPAALQFRIKLLEDRCDNLEKVISQLQRRIGHG